MCCILCVCVYVCVWATLPDLINDDDDDEFLFQACVICTGVPVYPFVLYLARKLCQKNEGTCTRNSFG